MSRPNVYDIGDLVELSGTFTDPATEEPVDPDVVACIVVKPNGETVEPDDISGDAGVYLATVEPDMAGVWWYAFDGTGGAQASGERQFVVRPQRVPRGS